jgi:hypothetical protein
MVPGKALPGGRARRRAVEGYTKAGVPVAMRIVPKPRPTVALEITRDGLASPVGANFAFVFHREMEVIRDQL